MRAFAFSIIAALGSLLLADEPVRAQEETENGIIPVRPQQLWEPMPAELETWKIRRSTAENRLGGWIESRAVREYEKIPETEGEPPEGPPATTRIVITDTGKHPSSTGHFAEFSLEAETEEGVEAKKIEGWPAYLVTYEEDKDLVLEIFVADRFLVEISITHQPARFFDEWVKRIDLASLAKIPGTEAVPLPEELIMFRLDQLNPKKNRSYRLATTSNSRLRDELLEDKAYLSELLGEIPQLAEEAESEELPE